MNVKNAVYREISPIWDEITLPLKSGTPMSKNGKVANGADAIGIVPQTIDVLPVTPSINLIVGGSVSLAEVEAACGFALAKEAKESMNGIAFYGEDGTPEPNPVYADNYDSGFLGSLQEVLPSAELLPSSAGVYVAAVVVDPDGTRSPYWHNMTGSDPSGSNPAIPVEEGEL